MVLIICVQEKLIQSGTGAENVYEADEGNVELALFNLAEERLRGNMIVQYSA